MATNIGPRIQIEGEKEYLNAINNIIQQTKTLDSEMKAVASSFTSSSTATNELGKTMEDAEGKTLSFADVLKANLLSQAIVSGVKKLADSVKTFAKEIVNTGMGYEAQMSRVKAISGATADDMERLEQKAIEMGSTTKFSATQSGEALEYMAMAGWETEDMLNGLSGVMYLAAASGEDLATTSDIVTDAMTAFKMSAGEAGHFADVLAVAATNANTDVGKMGDTFRYVATIAGTMEYNVEDTALAIGLMADNGLKATQAGTALRSIITRLATDAGASKNKLGALGVLTEELGVEFYNLDGSARNLSDVLLEAREAFKGLSVEQQASYAKTIAGQEAIAGWQAIMNSSDESIEKLTSSLENADGAAEAMAQTMNDNLAGDIVAIKSNLESLGISIYKKFEEPLRNAAGTVKDQVLPALKEFVGSGDIAKFVTDFQNIVSAIDIPNLLVSMSEGIKSASQQLLEVGKNTFDGFVTYLQENLPQFISSGLDTVLSFTSGLREGAGKLVDSALTLIKTLADGIVKSLPDLIQKVPLIVSNIAGVINDNAPKLLVTAGEIILQLAKGLVENIPVIVKNLPQIIGAIWDTITAFNWLNLGAKIITGIGDGAKNMGSSLLKTVKDIMQHPVDHIKGLVSSIKTIGGDIIHGLSSGISGMAGLVSSAVSGIKDIVWNGIKGLASSAVTWGRDMISGFADGILGAIRLVTDAVSEVAEKVTSFLHFSRPDVGPLRDYETWMPDFVQGLADGIKSNAWRVQSAVEGLASNIQLAPIQTSIQAMQPAAAAAAAGGYGPINITVNGAPGQDVNELANIVMWKIESATQRKGAVFG